jgi:hypothetical protein
VAPKPAEAAPPADDATQVQAPSMPAIAGLSMEKVLGRGGFARVLLAKRAADGRKVAVKIPNNDPDAIMRLELEGETLRHLGGIHAPALYDVPVLADGRPCLVMEFVPLPTLADRLGELENGMPIDEIGRRGLSLLTALEAVHKLDLVHRDLKPENVFSPISRRSRASSTSAWSSRRPACRSRTRLSARSWGRPSTWRPSSSTRRRPSTSAPTSTRSARSSTRCLPGGRRSGATPRRSSRRSPTGARARRRVTSRARRRRSRT